MPSEEIDGVVISSFPNASTIENNDVVTGLHNGNNANFLFSGIAAYIRQGLSNIFVPWSRIGTPNGAASLDSTGKVPGTQLPSIPSDAEDITYDPATSGLSATNVQDAVDEVQGEIDNLPSPPAPSDANPQDLGTAAAGSSADYSRADHVHKKPTAADIGAQDTITANGILKGDGAGGVSAATAGTDYQAPLMAGTDYATPAQLADKAAKADLTSIQATGTTNTTGSVIPAGAHFYLNGVLYRAKEQIGTNALFTPGTNCEPTTVGDSLVPTVVGGTVNTINTSGYVIISSIGGLCTVYFAFTTSAVIGTADVLATIPAAYKPLARRSPVQYLFKNPNATAPTIRTDRAGMYLNTDGTLTQGLSNALPSGYILQGIFTYTI